MFYYTALRWYTCYSHLVGVGTWQPMKPSPECSEWPDLHDLGILSFTRPGGAELPPYLRSPIAWGDVNSLVSTLPFLRPMGAQGIYRKVVAPQYSYTPKSSTPYRLELESTFLALSQVVTYINQFPSDWRG